MVLAGFFSAAKARGKIKASGEYFGMPCRVAVELGAGTGLAGLALAATQCATKRVVLTDIDAVLPLLRENAEGNRGVITPGAPELCVEPHAWVASTAASDAAPD